VGFAPIETAVDVRNEMQIVFFFIKQVQLDLHGDRGSWLTLGNLNLALAKRAN
jgi:hypothetical protein